MFPSSIQADFALVSGDGKERMIQLTNEIKKLRQIRQGLQKTAELSESYEVSRSSGAGKKDNERGSGGGRYGGRSEGSGRESGCVKDKKVELAMVTFSSPRRHGACRICVTLDDQGDTKDLYENHSSNYPTGRPRFASMKIQERLDSNM